jgi:hypothetical protein
MASPWASIGQLSLGAIEGYPMLIGTGWDENGEADHWSTLYGYGTNPRRVFLGTRSVRLFLRCQKFPCRRW